MNAKLGITDTRRVSGFERVILRAQHENELIIRQGEPEGLTIHGPPDVVPRIQTEVRRGTLTITMGGGWLERLGDALTTSLARPRIRYELTVKNLTRLEVYAMVFARAESLKAERLSLRFAGPGEMRLGAIYTRLLEVDLPGAARLEVGGYEAEQRVRIAGPARYEATRLKSHRAEVTVKGIGTASIWAAKELDVNIRGPGRVLYRGTPQVKHSIAPLGSLSCLDAA